MSSSATAPAPSVAAAGSDEAVIQMLIFIVSRSVSAAATLLYSLWRSRKMLAKYPLTCVLLALPQVICDGLTLLYSILALLNTVVPPLPALRYLRIPSSWALFHLYLLPFAASFKSFAGPGKRVCADHRFYFK
jgi:hypothetical protein